MNTGKLILAYLLTAVVFFSIVLTRLGWVAKDMYRKHLGGFLSDQVNWSAAFIFYALFIIGIFIFAILPAAEKNSLGHAVLYGALFGFFTYATYDLTNLATLKNWPLKIVFIDIIWGSVLTGSVAAAGYWIVKKILA
ncbi:MAG: DUF2177 family protein [Bacteroidota bacterium]